MAENFFTRVKARMRERWPIRYPKPGHPTQRHIATLAGVKQASVAKWAAGGAVDMKNAQAMAEKLDVCVEWLLSGRGPKFPTEPFMEDSDTAALLALWDELDQVQRRSVLELVRGAVGIGHRTEAIRTRSAPKVHESGGDYRAREKK